MSPPLTPTDHHYMVANRYSEMAVCGGQNVFCPKIYFAPKCVWYNLTYLLCLSRAEARMLQNCKSQFRLQSEKQFGYRFLVSRSIANLPDGGSLKWLP